ncbi:hypothetical protein INR49_008284 [Caranx melampygus]|nr:hypothetical protein INR49_008284 [Caranx melampygus]
MFYTTTPSVRPEVEVRIRADLSTGSTGSTCHRRTTCTGARTAASASSADVRRPRGRARDRGAHREVPANELEKKKKKKKKKEEEIKKKKKEEEIKKKKKKFGGRLSSVLLRQRLDR